MVLKLGRRKSLGRIRGITDILNRYQSMSSNSSYTQLRLQDDGEEASVRFLYEDVSEIEGAVVHSEKIDDKFRRIMCLESPDCPLCRAFGKPSYKVFFQVYDIAEGELKIWERPPAVLKEVQGFFTKFKPIYKTTYAVVRHGKRNDKGTRYQVYPVGTEADLELSSLPERIELFGPNAYVWERPFADIVTLMSGSGGGVPNKVRPERSRASSDEDLF